MVVGLWIELKELLLALWLLLCWLNAWWQYRIEALPAVRFEKLPWAKEQTKVLGLFLGVLTPEVRWWNFQL